MPSRKFPRYCGIVLLIVALGIPVALLVLFISVNIGGGLPTAVTSARPSLPPLISNSDKAKALEIIRETDFVRTVAGDQEWQVEGIVETYIAGSSKAASMKISWSEPITSTGPWLLLRCWGTRQVQVEQLLSNVQYLAVDIDLDRGQVVGLGALHAPLRRHVQPKPNSGSGGDIPSLTSKITGAVEVGPTAPGTWATIKDLRSGTILFRGTIKDIPTHANLCAPDEVDDGLSATFLAYGNNGLESRSIDYSDASYARLTGGFGPVGEIEKIRAIELVRKLGVIERLNGGQVWTATHFSRRPIHGTTYPMGLSAAWRTPVETSGPWIHFRCQSTKRWSGRQSFANVTQVRLTVDMDSEDIVAIGDSSPADNPSKVILFRSWYTAPYELARIVVLTVISICPPGRQDD